MGQREKTVLHLRNSKIGLAEIQIKKRWVIDLESTDHQLSSAFIILAMKIKRVK